MTDFMPVSSDGKHVGYGHAKGYEENDDLGPASFLLLKSRPAIPLV